MLVLTRKKDESLIIGDGIEVKILDIKGELIKIGISAPASVPIYRKEIYDQILKENLTAANMDVSLEDITKKISHS